ncbi:phosphoribosylaminoimidazolecarboxamide formyltransferase/IMP cyclohydrolase [Rubidibacter lacunae KORDI 51-2]|uniref:Bifunctional purine biosynthesis protein PurH n=1 Tax=Rubidibacter lacunae KORDI 51-2 TaxID=582515 RepID=U5DJJ1_9CHRO|nr:bifunctional phosphoribosylaminoimidazolecarboxamide formyltransferase/IMP cyclohydrolase [Rubidibacter lacunae]ERN39855.1 phosphoribosylaminoimidazolecarboxamide formyltransferase/IMP cyclohydrolase [Rubidibacter lacunae KORDI 51-2]
MTRLALLSVSDKTGLVEFARALVENFDFEIVSSGGTAKVIQEAGLPVTKVADYTGAPEILGGRVKTLHPRIHGGILARTDIPQDLSDLDANHIRRFDLVAVNLYPFEVVVAKRDAAHADIIENIDIGGPTLLRAAAKNYAHLTVLATPERYNSYLDELQSTNGSPTLEFRQARAAEAFARTACYERAIADYFAGLGPDLDELPLNYSVIGARLQTLRYGENPHQPAAWYSSGTTPGGWGAAVKLQGKELSYNNLVDLEAARRIIGEFRNEPAAAILKHTNPCGIAIASSLSAAYQQAFDADSISAFGGIVALNRAIDPPTAKAMTQTFLECVVAPDCEPEAASILARKSNLRVLVLPDLLIDPAHAIRSIAGGFLLQAADDAIDDSQTWQVASKRQPTPDQWAELEFAWKAAKHVKSNAIVVTRDRVTCGIGAGQMNRVGAVEIALRQAGDTASGASLASDGFFPFDDSVRAAAAAGISAIVQPGGSRRDEDSVAAANELDLVMVLTGTRHFLH